MATVLLYNIGGEKEAKIKLLCRKMYFDCRSVEKREYGAPLSDLLAGEGAEAPYEDFDGEMLYIAGIRGEMLNLFLDQLRRKKLSVPLKAIMTETNRGFTSAQLYRELCAEHEAIKKGLSAHQ